MEATKKWTPMIHQRDPRDEVLEWIKNALMTPPIFSGSTLYLPVKLRDQMVNRINDILTKGGTDADRLRQV